MTSKEAQWLNDKATAGLLDTIERGQAVLMERFETVRAENGELRSALRGLLEDAANFHKQLEFWESGNWKEEWAGICAIADRLDFSINYEEGTAIDLKVR